MKSSSDTDQPTTAGGESMFALLHAAHALEDKIEASLASVGLSGPKYSVLTALVAAGEPVALGELAGRLSCVKSNVTQMVDRLEADGLVRRIADPEDRRSVKAEVTSVGRERQTAGAAVIDTLEAQFSQAVRAEDRSAVSRLLRSIHSV